MNQNIFNFTRFKNLFIRDLFENLKPMATTIVGVFVVLSLMLYIMFFTNEEEQIKMFYKSVFQIVFILSSLFISGNAFRDFRNKEQNMNYLMLPSSTLEKFLSQYLLVTVVFTVLVLLFHYLFGLVNLVVVNSFKDYSIDINYLFNTDNVLPFLRVFIPLQLLLLAGAVTFKKVPLFATLLSQFLYTMVNGLIIIVVMSLIFSNLNEQHLHLSNNFFLVNGTISGEISADSFSFWSFKAFYYFWQYLLPIFSIIYIWFKIKEKEA